MPKRILPLLAMLLAFTASADSVRRLEVFIDSDPGPGNGSPVSVAGPAQADSVLSTFSYVLPLNLAPGRHSLYVRALADTAGAAPRWSLVQRRDFYVPEAVVAAEYFFDTDPGPGAGTPTVAPTPADSVSLNAGIATTGLGAGKHMLYLRTRSNAGRWGLAERREFYVQPAITAAEYFYDTDPGTGTGTALAIAAPGDTVSPSWSFATPNTLAAGRHHLYVRTRSGAAWALSPARAFDVLPLLNAAEYFIDTDPGPGNGTALGLSSPADTVQLSPSIGTTGLSPGRHLLYIRSRNAEPILNR